MTQVKRVAGWILGFVGFAAALLLAWRVFTQSLDLFDGLFNDPSKASTIDLFTEALYIGIAAMGLNILTGYNGQVSIGHGAFFGVGAYASAILMFDHGWAYLPTLPIAGLICLVVGILVGIPALRVKGLYLALVTLGLAVVFPDLTKRFVDGTGGTNLISLKTEQISPPYWYDWFPDFIADPLTDYVGSRDQWAFWLAVAVAVATIVTVWFISRSRFGRALIAVRDHESAAVTVGVNNARVKVSAFAISAFFAGLAGSLSVLVSRLANAGKVETFQLSILLLVAVVVGGTATVWGPMLGAFVVVFAQDYIDEQDTLTDLLDPPRAKLMSPALFGIALIILMYVLPDGIVGGARRGLRSLSRRRAAPIDA
ncbi:MAG: branched-chain amino acid ABC transporter permease [Actinomycetota bacterium]|nr:branched-chain amino acid ABC transporter permease [Actinomycetota bacterium]